MSTPESRTLRCVGGPNHGKDVTTNAATILYSQHDEDCERVVTYRLRSFGALGQDGTGWKLDVLVAPEVDRHEGDGQLLAHLLDAFIQDLPGARHMGKDKEA